MRQNPISFTYNSIPFKGDEWSPASSGQDTTRYTSPDGKLRLEVTIRHFPGFPVTEILPVIECVGKEETGILEEICSLHLIRPCAKPQLRVRCMTGSETKLTDFTRHDALLQDRVGCNALHLTTDKGLSSSVWLPYFGIDLDSRHGLEVAVGWSGGWRADIEMRKEEFELNVGLDGARFKLLPGERFVLPSILLLERENLSVADGLVQFHRLMLTHFSPRDSHGRLFRPWLPIGASGGNKTDENMLRIINFAQKEFPGFFDVFWVDANWYGKYRETLQEPNCGPGWSEYVGDWHPNTWAHPDGNLKKVSDAAHQAGMKFLMWFEPERATDNAPIVTEHPEYFHRMKNNPSPHAYLLDLGNPEAREWAIQEVCRNIDESGIDIYRQDCNFAGRERVIWNDHDEPDRKGVLEIRHINGLYAFWDELRRRYPDLLIENCAAGGRRMDYQLMSRSHSYCRDDAHMFKNCDELTQNITLNSTAYIPITGGETFTVPVFDDYAFLSRLAAGTVFSPTDFQGMLLKRTPSPEELEWFRKMFSHAKRIQRFFLGDYYILTDIPFDSSEIFCAYQLHLPESDEGFFTVFRRQDCPFEVFTPSLHAILPDATYAVEEMDGKTVELKGSQLASWTLRFDRPRTCRWFFYRKIAPLRN